MKGANFETLYNNYLQQPNLPEEELTPNVKRELRRAYAAGIIELHNYTSALALFSNDPIAPFLLMNIMLQAKKEALLWHPEKVDKKDADAGK